MNDRPTQKLPLKVGQSIMDTIHKLNDELYGNLSELIYGPQPLFWEMFCSPDSSLANACMREGIPVQRVNLSNNFDLYRQDTYVRLWELFLKQRPKKIWISTMCTLFCDWVDLNYSHRREVLENRRRRERKMFKMLTKFLLDVVNFDKEVDLYWEWPHRCRGWKEKIIEKFFYDLGETFVCRLDGCRFGLKSANGIHIQKAWRVVTTDIKFYGEFRLKVCHGGHPHEWLHGAETSKSAYYPPNMCKSIAQHWRKMMLPTRWWRLLWSAEMDPGAFQVLHAAEADETSEGYEPSLAPSDALHPEPAVPAGQPHGPGEGEEHRAADHQGPSAHERALWEAQLAKFHKASGHPSNRSLVRMLTDAQLPRWKIQMAEKFKCAVCEELRMGGTASKQIPAAAIRPLPEAWEQLGIDVGEWEVPHQNCKVKFILMIDLATRYRVIDVLFKYKHGEKKIENSDMVIKSLVTKWFMDKPRPKYLVPDNAKSLMSLQISEFMNELRIAVVPPPDQEKWAHGITERAIGHIKATASLIQSSMPDQDPELSLALATSAINSTEFNKGFTSMQWIFGRQAELDHEEFRQQLQFPVERQQDEFLRLMTQRQHAEECARKAKAHVVMSKLRNTNVKQPIRNYDLAEPVYVWRKFLPYDSYRGRRGGRQKTMKPRWVGPGRVVFHELVPGQRQEDRKHILWVLLNNKLYRVSVHSVRPLSERERQIFDATGDGAQRWRQLSDVIPSREFTDLVDEEPGDDDMEEPFLPPGGPDWTTERIKPAVRFRGKHHPTPEGLPQGLPDAPDQVNEYEDPDPLDKPMDPIIPDAVLPEAPSSSLRMTSRRTSTTSMTPLMDSNDIPAEDEKPDTVLEEPVMVEEPEPKRPKMDDGDEEDASFLELQQALQEVEDGYLMQIDIEFSSKRQNKDFLRDPTVYLTKKIASSEVNFRKLNAEEKALFEKAKASEVSSFIKAQAVRRCLTYEEVQKAKQSDRVLKARWVLVWKNVPSESREEALQDQRTKPNSVVDATGERKAKARIVLLGFQHPDLESPTFSTTAPVQSHLMRQLSLTLCAQKGWDLEGLDMSTAFLQTGGEVMEQNELWTSGVPELKKALGASDTELLRLRKNVYGNANAPRGLWQDVNTKLTRLGGHRLIGDNSFWIWVEENPHPKNEADCFTLIGFVGGHVDDFNRAGDVKNEKWLQIRAEIDRLYRWGTTKVNVFRHTGIDLEVCEKGDERWVNLSQDFYTETLPDLAVDKDRLKMDPNTPLTSAEMAACRATLGALQWTATQTQLHICARVNLLLTELTINKNMAVAKELQDLVREVRQDPVCLRLWRLPSVQHWQDMCVVTMADQAHANRPQGGSTGGWITCLGGPEQVQGQPGRLNIVAWRTWRLKRKAISTNDGEIQAVLEGEDANYRARFMWCQLNGCAAIKSDDKLKCANDCVKFIKGILATDSKGSYDAVNKSEGPLLGLSHVRSALQAYQLREQLTDSACKLIWISGDWNLGDALTKKAKTAREGLLQFLKNNMWRLTFDPSMVISERKSRKQGTNAVVQMRQLQALIPCSMVQEDFGLMRQSDFNFNGFPSCLDHVMSCKGVSTFCPAERP